MKYLLILLLLISCASWTTSKHKCDNKPAPNKETCLKSYKNFVRHLDYVNFRGGGKRGF